MTQSRMLNMLIGGCVLAVGLATVACGDNANRTSNKEPAATNATPTDSRGSNAVPITMTGCLQKGNGMMSSYILTQATRESGSVGTSGTAASGTRSDASKVEREQANAAARSYRLSGDNGQLGDLVGHKIRVTGTITDQGDTSKTTAPEHGTTGTADDRAEANRGTTDRDRSEVKEGDLAKVEVSSVESMADTCSITSTGNTNSTEQPRTNR